MRGLRCATVSRAPLKDATADRATQATRHRPAPAQLRIRRACAGCPQPAAGKKMMREVLRTDVTRPRDHGKRRAKDRIAVLHGIGRLGAPPDTLRPRINLS
jgi:hypothetical protein